MRCAGCSREMKEGDLCIRAKASELLGISEDVAVNHLMASIFGGGDKLVLCQDCTERGGGFDVEVYHEEAS